MTLLTGAGHIEWEKYWIGKLTGSRKPTGGK
jgi:hypothetical protein